MIKLRTTARQFCITMLCIGTLACASTPVPDQRPQIMLSAEKSLELGVSNYLENNFGKAESHFNRALFLYRNIDNPDGIITSCLNLTKTKLSSGQTEAARVYLKMAQNTVQREQLTGYNDRLTLIQSSINIEEENYTEAQQHTDNLLSNAQTGIDDAIYTAVLQNQIRIAFLTNADDKSAWLTKYREALKKPGQNTPINHAHLLRFEAALNPDTAEEKFSSALSLYRNLAHSPGIATTLTEWAEHDISSNNPGNAIEKLQRALFIRANQQHKKASQNILRILAAHYKQPGDSSRTGRADYWLQQLKDPSFKQWDLIISEFEH